MGNAEKTGTDRLKTWPNITRPFFRSIFETQMFILFPHTTILLNRKTMADDPGHREYKIQERTGTGNNFLKSTDVLINFTVRVVL